MGDEPRTNGAPALTIAEGDPVRIRAQIEQTRVELGDTVAALAHKTDVKQQARERVAATREKAMAKKEALLHRDHDHEPRPALERASHAGRLAAERTRAHPLAAIAVAAAAGGFLLGRLSSR